jgi:opacity protein-like surface antigen
MRFKSLLLGAASIAVIGSASQAQAGPFYVSVFGGLNFLTDKSAATSFTSQTNRPRFHTTSTHTGAISEKSRTGFVLGGAVGVHLDRWVDGLRGELEASYRRNHIHGNWNSHVTTHHHRTSGGEGSTRSTTSGEGTISGHMSTFAMMANVWYDIDIGSKLKPYVGGGAGWARSRVDLRGINTAAKNNSSTTTSNENSGFAYQLGAGVRYEFMHDASVGIGYRYFRGPDVNIFFGGKFANQTQIPLKFRDENHSVDLSLSIDID